MWVRELGFMSSLVIWSSPIWQVISCTSILLLFLFILSDPFRYILTFFYARHIINKRYLETALETISHQDQSAKDAVASVKRTSLKDEESKNPKIKSTRIITIKGKNNSSINLWRWRSPFLVQCFLNEFHFPCLQYQRQGAYSENERNSHKGGEDCLHLSKCIHLQLFWFSFV